MRNIYFTSLLVLSGCFALALSWTPWAIGTDGTIGILPPSTSLRLFAGDNGSYQLKIHNGMGRQITLHITITATAPTGGSVRDLLISFQGSSATDRSTSGVIVAKAGNIFLTILVNVSPAAIPGLYHLTNMVSL